MVANIYLYRIESRVRTHTAQKQNVKKENREECK